MDEVKVVAVGGAGTGLQPGTEVKVETPAGQPNASIQVVGPLVALFVRFGHLYFLTLSGIIGGAITAHALAGSDTTQQQLLIHYADFGDLVWKSAQLSLAVPGVGLIKDLVTIFGKLEQRFPFLTGNV